MATPQTRSLEWLRKRGYTAVTVEALKRFPDKRKQACTVCGNQPMVMVRVDLFNFGDILAFNGTNTVIIQCTSKDHMSHRWRKIQESPEAKAWLNDDLGRNIVVHGWYQDGRFWKVKERMFSAEDFEVTRMSDWDEPETILPFA